MFASGQDDAIRLARGILSRMDDGVVMWDFDGTLAWRPGMWGACVLEVLDEQTPEHTGTLERIRADLRDGFPWHRPDRPHPELGDPQRWWASVTPLLARAITGAGIGEPRATELAGAVAQRFPDGTRAWRVFDDTRPALEATASAGWRNVILSNHVPELPRLVSDLGLDDLIERVFNSASIGYEKPNPEAFRHALRGCGDPPRRWMVGDNPVADVAGARALGIPAILVRSEGGGPDALAASAQIVASAGTP
jgi:putative hydrolase of the HAD superfamily